MPSGWKDILTVEERPVDEECVVVGKCCDDEYMLHRYRILSPPNTLPSPRYSSFIRTRFL